MIYLSLSLSLPLSLSVYKYIYIYIHMVCDLPTAVNRRCHAAFCLVDPSPREAAKSESHAGKRLLWGKNRALRLACFAALILIHIW